MNRDQSGSLAATTDESTVEACAHQVGSIFVDWNPAKDAENLRSSAVRLRNLSARHLRGQFVASISSGKPLRSDLVYWRRRALYKAEGLIGREIGGRVLEIGAGAAWCSGELSRRAGVVEAWALDYEEYCVKELMPLAHRLARADHSKIRRVLGSYNAMAAPDEYFDFVISMGALHHSEDLSLTMRECRRVLNPNGWMIALEPCEYDSISRLEAEAAVGSPLPSSVVRATYGETIDPKESVTRGAYSNHAFRLLEYEYHALAAGLQPWSVVFDASAGGGTVRLLLRAVLALLLGDRCLPTPHSGGSFYRFVHYPYFARGAFRKSRLVYDRLLLLARREQLDEKS